MVAHCLAGFGDGADEARSGGEVVDEEAGVQPLAQIAPVGEAGVLDLVPTQHVHAGTGRSTSGMPCGCGRWKLASRYGAMVPEGRYVTLDWRDCRNARDVGGLVGADGRRVRTGALVRSDDHHRLTPTTVRAVRASGVTRIVDLRWAWECQQYPSPFAGDAVYRHVPMLADVLTYDPPADTYGPMLDHNRERIAAAFRTVAQAPPGGVVVHCLSGRDRTGVLVGLLLAVAGVGPKEIAADYARTEGCSPLPMLNTLAHTERRYGGAASYLIGSGAEPQLLDAVRTRLLE